MEIRLNNIYDDWLAESNKIKNRLLVFTPYFDDSLTKIFECGFGKERYLITNFSEDYFFDNPYQLIAIKKISDLKVEIRHFDNLHAKIYLRDFNFLSIGSQNFTRKGKTNQEASVIINKKKRIKDIWDFELSEIFDNSKVINREIINELFNELKPNTKKFPKSKKKIRGVFRKTKLSEKKKILKLKYEEKRKFYFTAKIDNDPSRFYKVLKYKKQNTEIFRKMKLQMVPLINLDTLGVMFARIGTTRISRLSFGVSWNDSTKYFADLNAKIVTRFGEFENNRNVRFKIESDQYNKEAYIFGFFDGFIFDDLYFKSEDEKFVVMLKEIFYRRNSFAKVVNEELISYLMRSFRFEKPLQSSRKMINTFLSSEGKYLVTGIEDNNGNIFFTIEREKIQ